MTNNLGITSIDNGQLNLLDALYALTTKNKINNKEVWLELLDVIEKYLSEDEIGEYTHLEYNDDKISIDYKDSYYDTDLEQFTKADLLTVKELQEAIKGESTYEELTIKLEDLRNSLRSSQTVQAN